MTLLRIVVGKRNSRTVQEIKKVKASRLLLGHGHWDIIKF